MNNDLLKIADRTFSSRLIIGTGKFPSNESLRESLEASGSQMVTIALRRVNSSGVKENILDFVDTQRVLIVPNTSGARDARDAVRLARLGRSMGISDWVKLEITPEPRHLLPDPIETLKAAEELVKDGFKVMPYINADPVLAKRLEEVGTVCVMPLGAPIGTNKGLKTADSVRIIVENSRIPVVVDAGLGAPSHAVQAMELGVDAVLVNTAIAVAGNPARMAEAFALAVKAGRSGFLAGLAPERESASASSPLTGFLSGDE